MQLWMGILSRLLRRSLLVLEIRESERNSSLCGGELWIPIFAAPWRKFARLPRGRWKPFAGLEKQTVCFGPLLPSRRRRARFHYCCLLQRPCLPPFTLELQKMHLQLSPPSAAAFGKGQITFRLSYNTKISVRYRWFTQTAFFLCLFTFERRPKKWTCFNATYVHFLQKGRWRLVLSFWYFISLFFYNTK